jgi:hypothetical protein
VRPGHRQPPVGHGQRLTEPAKRPQGGHGRGRGPDQRLSRRLRLVEDPTRDRHGLPQAPVEQQDPGQHRNRVPAALLGQRGLLEDLLGFGGPLQSPVQVPAPDARPAGPLDIVHGRLAVHDRRRLGVAALPLQRLGQDPHSGRAATSVHRGAGQALSQLVVKAGGCLAGRLQQQVWVGGHACFQLPGPHP